MLFAVLLGSLLAANIVKKSIPFLRESLIPTSVLGRNKLNIYYKDKIYQIKGDKRFNALKYVHLSHRSENIRKGQEDVKFLGL